MTKHIVTRICSKNTIWDDEPYKEDQRHEFVMDFLTCLDAEEWCEMHNIDYEGEWEVKLEPSGIDQKIERIEAMVKKATQSPMPWN